VVMSFPFFMIGQRNKCPPRKHAASRPGQPPCAQWPHPLDLRVIPIQVLYYGPPGPWTSVPYHRISFKNLNTTWLFTKGSHKPQTITAYHQPSPGLGPVTFALVHVAISTVCSGLLFTGQGINPSSPILPPRCPRPVVLVRL